jgi:hypothetical protein
VETETATDSRTAARSLWRIALVTVLTAIALLMAMPDIILPWHPTAEFGMDVDAMYTVMSVDPGSSAARAGIVAGDRIDMAATPFDSRTYVQPGVSNSAPDGTRARFTIVHAGTPRDVELVGGLVPRSLADNVTDVILIVAEVGLILISTTLVLTRPSRMTWAFYLFGISSAGLDVTDVAYFPRAVTVFLVVVQGIVYNQWLWLVVFALRFPNDDPRGWRRAAERILLCSLVVFVPLGVWIYAGALVGSVAPPFVPEIFGIASIGGLLAAALVFVATYLSATVIDRARIRWVMFGLLVGFSGQLTYYLLGSGLPGVSVAWPIWLLNLSQSAEIFVAITVAYAIVRHRVFDVRFFIGRAVVYGIMTTLVVATLALVDFAVGKILSGTRLAALGEAGVAIVVGLSLNGVHKRLEGIVDRTLFRSRIEAARRLRRVGRGMAHVTTLESIEHIVVREPAEAYDLASAALFSRREDGTFARTDSIGWDAATAQTIDADESLVLQLLASNDPVPANHIVLKHGALPAGTLRPSCAMPISVRSVLEAIVFYGPHKSQEDLDPDEIESLEGLLAAASSAYDHVRATLAQKKLEDLEAEVRAARTMDGLPRIEGLRA